MNELPVITSGALSDEERQLLAERRAQEERKAAAERLASRIPACAAVVVVDGEAVAVVMPPA